MAHKKDGLCANTVTDNHTVNTLPPAVYDGGVLSHAKSMAIFNFFFHSFMQLYFFD